MKKGKAIKPGKVQIRRQLEQSWKQAVSGLRREQNAGIKPPPPDARQQGNAKRDISQVNFRSQHWWGNGDIFKRRVIGKALKRGMNLDEAKAALIYEAMRRHPNIQKAWQTKQPKVNGKRVTSPFIATVIENLPLCWTDLNEITKQVLVDLCLDPLFPPPRGYSMFPDSKTSPEKCRAAALKVLSCPDVNDSIGTCEFIARVRALEQAGLVIVAVDNRSRERLKFAIQALQNLPPGHRKDEQAELLAANLPSNLGDPKWRTLARKLKKAKDKKGAIGDAIQSVLPVQPQGDLTGPWETLLSPEQHIAYKRTRRSKWQDTECREQSRSDLLEAQRFDVLPLFRSLESLDNRTTSESDFISRLRFF